MTAGRRRKILLVVGIALLAAAYFGFGLHRYLTLDFFKDSRQALIDYRTTFPARSLAAYFLLYVLVAGLSLPGATVLTLAGGAIWGFWTTLVVVSFASTVGATAACALCRFLFRELASRRLGPRFAAIDAGLQREGPFYLFTLRLVPIFPFFAINAAMGLTGMPLRTFYWVSQLGMLPATAVYVNAGRELGRIDSLSGIMAPRLLLAFALLGILPLAAHKALQLRRARQASNRPHGQQSPGGNRL